jgi:predicted chitinase
MKISELLVEQQATDEGLGKNLAGAALAGAMALGGTGAKAATAPQDYQADPINAMVQQKETEKLNALDRAKLQDILKLMQADKDAELAQQPKPQPMSPAAQADPTKNLKPGAAKPDFRITGAVTPNVKLPTRPVAKPAPQAYKPITGKPAETALHNFAVKVGLKGNELAAFMGQSAHESDGFKTAEEYASGDAYEGRKDFGNIYRGDGRKYKGRGFIQITGRDNYTAAGKALGLDLVNHPELAEKPVNAAKVTWWYWKNKVRPNIGNFDNTKAITKKIQGGSGGLQSREKYTQSFKLAQK